MTTAHKHAQRYTQFIHHHIQGYSVYYKHIADNQRPTYSTSSS